MWPQIALAALSAYGDSKKAEGQKNARAVQMSVSPWLKQGSEIQYDKTESNPLGTLAAGFGSGMAQDQADETQAAMQKQQGLQGDYQEKLLELAQQNQDMKREQAGLSPRAALAQGAGISNQLGQSGDMVQKLQAPQFGARPQNSWGLLVPNKGY